MDTPVEIESFPVKDLPDRYSIGRTILYERMNALNITPEKQGNRGYVSIWQLSLLDDLDKHIKSGQTTPEFLRQHGITGKQETYSVRSVRSERGEQMDNGTSASVKNVIAPSQMVTAAGEMVAALSEVANAIAFSREQDPLIVEEVAFRKLRMLEEAATMGWTLPTSLVKQLLGRSALPQTVDGWFIYGSFRFLQTGKIGNQNKWKVTKL